MDITANAAAPDAGQSGLEQLQRVAKHMARLNVPGLPRNYELFHEGLFGCDPDLSQDVKAIGPNPPQALLDQIGLKHQLVAHCGIADEMVHQESATILKQLVREISAGLDYGNGFRKALAMINEALQDGYTGSSADLKEEIDFLRSASLGQAEAESKLRTALSRGIERIEDAERRAGTAKKAVLRDRVTALPNRIAFQTRLDALYAGDTDPKSTALVVVAIDRFNAMAQSFGDAAVKRLLKRLAAILRKTIKKNDFVARIAVDEFAFLFDDVSVEDAETIAERLFTAIGDNLVFATDQDADDASLTFAIGYALSGAAVNAPQLQSHAMDAMRAARGNRLRPIACHPASLPPVRHHRSA